MLTRSKLKSLLPVFATNRLIQQGDWVYQLDRKFDVETEGWNRSIWIVVRVDERGQLILRSPYHADVEYLHSVGNQPIDFAIIDESDLAYIKWCTGWRE